MEKFFCLGNQAIEDLFANMPEVADCNTGKKVQVPPAVKVPYPAPFALRGNNGIPVVGVRYILFSLLNERVLHFKRLL